MGERGGPLAGLKVLEFGQIAAGPFAGSLLADLGADVVKVERPDGGDDMRRWPPLNEGPIGERGAFDATMQGISGVMSVTGETEGPPVKCGVPLGDFGAGLYAAFCITSAILRARETGEGAFIDCSMLGGLLGMAALQTSEFFGTGNAPRRLGSAHPRAAPYQGFQASDAPFMIAAGNDKLWLSVCDVVGLQELKTDPRFQTGALRATNQKALEAVLQREFAKRPKADWLAQI